MESKESAVLNSYFAPPIHRLHLCSGFWLPSSPPPSLHPTTTLCVVVLLGRELGIGCRRVVGHLGPKLQLLLS
jgi:hypothetical protein